jgi:hypothetical protein
MKLTHEHINSAKTLKGGWTKAQLEVIGIAWPPANGWQHSVIGKEISDADYQRFRELASVRAKPNKYRDGILAAPFFDGEPPEGMNELVAWMNAKLELEKVARSELEKQISVLQFQLEALRNEVREARKASPVADTGNPALPEKTAWTPPWEV